MPTPIDLRTAFEFYWGNMDGCRKAGAYWALLHVTVCLPDICAALESLDGEATKGGYIKWSDTHLINAFYNGHELYGMRCKVLHQGRAEVEKKFSSRYTGCAFTEPSLSGCSYHRVQEGTTLVLDVDQLSQEVKRGVEHWIGGLMAQPTSQEMIYVNSHLNNLVQTRPFSARLSPDPTHPAIIINRSS